MRKCGLVTEKGNLVPLKDVSVEIQISGFVAHVISSLQYKNEEDNPIEAEFTFPLDEGSAVYKFEAWIENRHIVAECQEKEEARQTYDDAIAAGDTAMLLEEDDSAGDIFRCTVGNLPPKTDAKLIIGYVIELPVEHDGKLRFTLPVILNPRYSPNVGGLDAAKGATYVLKQRDIPYSFKLSATVEGSKGVKSVTASQPHIEVEQGENNKSVKVAFKDDFAFDSDVRLFVEYEQSDEPECLVENGDSEKGLSIEDREPIIFENGSSKCEVKCHSAEDTAFIACLKGGFLGEDILMINMLTKVDNVGTTNKGEYIFVLDRSGSMGFGKNRISHAKEALLLFLKSLPVGCYFNIVSFGSSHTFLFQGGSKEYTEDSLKTAEREVQGMQADMGGTEILRPLQDIYSKSVLKGHPRQIFLLTDGEVSNVREVINIAKKNCSNTRSDCKPRSFVMVLYTEHIKEPGGALGSFVLVFSIGIGEGASTALVNGVARAGNGKAEFIKDSERIQPKVVSLLKFAMQPSITEVTIGWELPTMVTAVTMPEMPPCLFDGDRLILYAILQGYPESQISGKVYINGKTDKGPANFSANFFYDKSVGVSSFLPLHRLAAKAQIKQLEDKDDQSEETKKQIIAVSVASNMVSKHTSFVAIDQERKEKVKGKQIQRHVPLLADMCLGFQPCSLGLSSLASFDCVDGTIAQKMNKGASFSFFKNPFKGFFSNSEKRGMPSGMSLVQNRGADATFCSYDDDSLGRPKIEAQNATFCSYDDDSLGRPKIEAQRYSKSASRFSLTKMFKKKKKGGAPVDADMSSVAPTKGDAMMNMISFQSFRGNWTLSSEICNALTVEAKALKALKLSENDDVTATLVVLVWLKLNFSNRHDEWEMIENKAANWLSSQGMDQATVKDKMSSIEGSLASSLKA